MDNEMRSLQKINDRLGGGGGGGGGGLKEIYSGNGDPNGVITPSVGDALYRQLDSLPIGLIWTWEGSGPWIPPDT